MTGSDGVGGGMDVTYRSVVGGRGESRSVCSDMGVGEGCVAGGDVRSLQDKEKIIKTTSNIHNFLFMVILSYRENNPSKPTCHYLLYKRAA